MESEGSFIDLSNNEQEQSSPLETSPITTNSLGYFSSWYLNEYFKIQNSSPLMRSWGPLPGGPGGPWTPQFLEKINEFFKFTIDYFNNFDALDPPVLYPWRTHWMRLLVIWKILIWHFNPFIVTHSLNKYF